MFLALLLCNLLVASCGMNDTKKDSYQCYKVWDKTVQRIAWECEKVSQSTRDGER
jgi:hypothetical protein